MPDSASQSPHLEPEEQEQAGRHAALPPLVIHEIVRAEGEAELERPVGAMFWSALAAGLSMGFSFAVMALLQSALPPGPGWHAVASFGYAAGFLIVVLGRQQLFTETTLTAVLPVRLWNVVLAANIIGTWIFAAALAYGRPLPPETEPALEDLAIRAIGHDFGETFLRAIFAGWLIALMVWVLPSARDARFWVVLFLTWIVALGGFSHIIAGSAEAAYAVMLGKADGYGYVMGFMIPTLIGNSVGGISLVALLNHAPVKGELDRKTETPS